LPDVRNETTVDAGANMIEVRPVRRSGIAAALP
jgi:hypothetical protein